MKILFYRTLSILSFAFLLFSCNSSKSLTPLKTTEVGFGWSSNSVNTVIFRQNAITTYKNAQFTAYYDADSFLVLAQRTLPNGIWQTQQTAYKGNTADAHNAISIAVDGSGYLHVSWDHHNNELRYARSKEPLSLELGEKMPMTGNLESRVSYPQFYNLPSGDLLFMYRSGESGRGSLVLNKYDTAQKEWSQLHSNLIDGEDARNAYWQAYVDTQGSVHLSWVWRETWDVETNHDIAYAKSLDGGKTWVTSTEKPYALPITASSAEYAWEIPQNSSLINQTAMTADQDGNPYIVNYWNTEGTTQYHLVYKKDDEWKVENTAFRTTGFTLGGGGTKKIPISRPEIILTEKANKTTAFLIFRDDLRGSKISIASKQLASETAWSVQDITVESVGAWEPNFDKELFKTQKQLHLFKQQVIQIDGEGLKENEATPVEVLEVNLDQLTIKN